MKYGSYVHSRENRLVHPQSRPGRTLLVAENISETDSVSKESEEKLEARRCAYIAAGHWQAGAPPFCGERARHGSSYCALHAPLCGVDPASREGARIAAEQADAVAEMPPEAWPHLASCAVPEPLEEEDPLEAWDLPFNFGNDAEEG